MVDVRNDIWEGYITFSKTLEILISSTLAVVGKVVCSTVAKYSGIVELAGTVFEVAALTTKGKEVVGPV